MAIVSGWAAVAMICIAADQAAMIPMPRRTARLETTMSDKKLPDDEPACPTDDDEDPIDVPVANSGGNGPPPPPDKK